MTNYCHNSECVLELVIPTLSKVAGNGEHMTVKMTSIELHQRLEMIEIVLQIVSEHEAVCLKTVTNLDTVSRGSGIMLRCQENWILKCDGGLDRGVFDPCS